MIGTDLLGTKDVAATIAVKTLPAAKGFYEGTLGLTPLHSDDEVCVYRTGQSTLMVYRSQYAGTNRATSATWTVGNDIEEVVRALESKGVVFEHYDLPGMKREGNIHVGEGMKVAWFRDPEGNILSLVTG